MTNLGQYSKSRLIELVSQHSLQFGDFTLASGKKAKFYLDCRLVTLHPEGAAQIGAGMLEVLQADLPDAVGGMAIGADPITGAIVTIAGQQSINLLGFIVRKEAKQHGMGRQVEGPVRSGMSCVVVEDVVTSGGSALKAVEAVQEFGMHVTGVLALIDRLEGGREAIEAAGLTLTTLLTIADFDIQ
jgi:orotate phosphoribosyltransferase